MTEKGDKQRNKIFLMRRIVYSERRKISKQDRHLQKKTTCRHSSREGEDQQVKVADSRFVGSQLPNDWLHNESH